MPAIPLFREDSTFGLLTEAEAVAHRPHVVRVDAENRIINTLPEIPGPDTPVPEEPVFH